MTKFKGVEGGTPTGAPLCRTCIFAHYTHGLRLSDVHLYCRMIQGDGVSGELTSEAYECTQYADGRKPSLENMQKTAWILRTDEFRKAIGFVSPQEWRKKFRKDDDPWDWE